MEKKNILKLLALIVLMTVVFCGAAFAAETNHTHSWVPFTAREYAGWGFDASFVDGTVPTCTQAATTIKWCNTCTATTVETVATGDEDGYRKSVNGDYVYFDITVNAKADTKNHLNSGYTKVGTSDWYYTGNAADKIGSIKMADCVTPAYQEYKCSACAGNYKVYFKMTAEGKVDVNHVLPTNDKLDPEWEAATAGHHFPAIETATEPYIVYKNGFVNSGDSSKVAWTETKATCETPYSKYVQCLECGYKLTVTDSNAPAHDFQKETRTINATCNQPGEKITEYRCSVCDILDTTKPVVREPINAVPHDKAMAVFFGWVDEEGNALSYPLTNNAGQYIAGDDAIWENEVVNGNYIVTGNDGKDTLVPYTLTKTVVKPVCGEKDGSITVTCSLCKVSKTVIIEKGEHKWEFGQHIVRPNYSHVCTIEGVRTDRCINPGCNAERKVTVAAEKDHDYWFHYVQTVDTDAMYQKLLANGAGKVWDDANGNGKVDAKEEGTVVPLVISTNELGKLSQCDDYIIVTGCANPDCEYRTEKRAEAQDAAKHTYADKPNVSKAASCFEEGYYLYNCLSCSETKMVKIEKTAHTWGEVKTTSATCDKEGTITKTCKVVGCGATDPQKIAALGHDLKVVTVEGNCTEKTVVTTTCTRCDYLKTETKTVKHTQPATKPTTVGTLTAGFTYYKFPTCTDAGACSYICTKCGEKVENEAIKALGHEKNTKPIADKAIPASCTEGAYDVYYCSVCKTYRKEAVKGSAALGHMTVAEMGNNVDYKKAPDCDETGIVAYKCAGDKSYTFDATTGKHSANSCGQYIEAEVPALGHELKAVYNPDTKTYETYCVRCEELNETEKAEAEYNVAVNGKQITIKPTDKDNDKLAKAYIRVAVGYELNGFSYSVVYVVEVEFDGEGIGRATMANVQGAGTMTGISYMVVTNPDADELTFGAALKDSYGKLIG